MMKTEQKREYIHHYTPEHQTLADALLQNSRIVSPEGPADHPTYWLNKSGYSIYRFGEKVFGFTTRAFCYEPDLVIVPAEWWYLAFEIEGSAVTNFLWFRRKIEAETQIEIWRTEVMFRDPEPNYLF